MPWLTIFAVGRRSKKDRAPALVQGLLAENVRRLRDEKYRDLRSETARNKKLASDSDTTLSQVQRILSQELAPGIDIVERIARAFDARPHDLLTPYFGMSYQETRPDRHEPKPGMAVHDKPA